MTEKQQEEIDLLKELIADSSIANDEREIYQKALTTLLSQSGSEEPKVAKKMMPKKEKATSKTKATKKPKATKPTALPSDVDAMKKQIKERTGKTEAECEDIIAQYRMLRNKAKVNGAKRIAKLKNSDDLIAGTNVITPVAQIEKDAEIVKAKIEKQVEQIENKAEREVVTKDKTKDEVKIAVEKKVIKELAKLSDDMVLKSTTFVKNIQTELKKVDKTEAKNFLLGLRNEIDALLSKFGDGGTTEIYNIAEMNSSSSSVNPSKFARGGGVDRILTKEDIEILGVDRSKINEREWLSIFRMANYQDGATFILKDEKGLDIKPQVEYEWYIKDNLFAKGGGVDNKWKYLFFVQGSYGEGFEDLTAHENREDAKAEMRVYDENENYPHRVILRKVLTSDYEKGKYARGGGVNANNNDVRVKALIKNLDNTPYSIGLAILRERLLTYTANDLKTIEKNPSAFDNFFISTSMYKDYFNRVIEELKFDYENGGEVGEFANGGGVMSDGRFKLRGFPPIDKAELMGLYEDFKENFSSNIERFTKSYNKVHDSKLRLSDVKELMDYAKLNFDYENGGSLFVDNCESKYNSMSKNDKEELMREIIGVGRTPFSEYEKYNQLSDYHKELVDNYFENKFARGGGVDKFNIAYIDATGIYMGKPYDKWKLVTNILKKHNIEVNNSKEWGTKGYAEELYEDIDGESYYTIKLNINDSDNPELLRKQIENLPRQINWQFTTDYEYKKGGGVMSDGSKKSFGQLDFNQLEYIFNVQLFGIEEEETKKLLDELNKEWLEMTKEEKKEILERYDEEILGKYENGGDVKEKIVKRFADYYEDENGNHVVSLTKEENGSGYYFLDTTNGFTGGVFKEKSRTKDALERYVRRYYKVVRKFADGGLIGNQKRIDLNENGKIDAEDFKLLRSSMNGAWRKEHKYVNSTSRNKQGKLIKHEIRYAKKNNSSRTGYKGKTNYAGGGRVIMGIESKGLVEKAKNKTGKWIFSITYADIIDGKKVFRDFPNYVSEYFNSKMEAEKSLQEKLSKEKQYAGGGGIEDSPSIYVADLEAYNDGRLNGEWLKLTDYNNADELMEAIQVLLDKWGVEEYAIHDTEYIPSNLSSEYMGQRDFEQLYEMIDLANEYNLPLEVVQDVVSQYDASAVEEYIGKYDSAIDFAEQQVDETGIESFIDFQQYLDISNTDRRLLANDFADSYVDDIKNEDGGNRVIEEAGLDVSEYEEADSNRQDEMLDEAVEIVREEYYNTWYDGLDYPYYFLVEEQGLYSADDFAKANFVRIDYDKLADALEQDYTFIYDSNSDLYVFNIR